MGMRRRSDRHLPLRMYIRRGAYYYVDASGKWHPLGREYVKAMGKYAEMTDTGRACTTLAQVIEKYSLYVTPHKAESTRKCEAGQLTRFVSFPQSDTG